MKTLDEMLVKRPIDPEELAELQAQVQAEIRAYRLTELRVELGFTQAALAEEIGVSQERIFAFERGSVDSAKIRTLRDYAQALGGELRVEVETADAVYRII